jgi:hypothetical protein
MTPSRPREQGALDRRSFLALAALALAALGAPGRALGLGRPSGPPRLDRRAARALARAYLDVAPEDADRARLRAALAARLGEGFARADAGAIAAAIRGDFATGDVVVVRGWLLARTECRLCAWATRA